MLRDGHPLPHSMLTQYLLRENTLHWSILQVHVLETYDVVIDDAAGDRFDASCQCALCIGIMLSVLIVVLMVTHVGFLPVLNVECSLIFASLRSYFLILLPFIN